MTLFPNTGSRSKPKAAERDERPRLRLPTGAPRLVESSTARSARSSTEAWGALLDAVRRSSTARLTLLSGRSGADRVSCPWERVAGCGASCRCGGVGTVTVDFLRRHYASLADDIEQVARPASPGRRA